jgi:hypothetical protein
VAVLPLSGATGANVSRALEAVLGAVSTARASERNEASVEAGPLVDAR